MSRCTGCGHRVGEHGDEGCSRCTCGAYGDPSDYGPIDRLDAEDRAALEVPCPFCGAATGVRCIGPRSGRSLWWSHTRRSEARTEAADAGHQGAFL